MNDNSVTLTIADGHEIKFDVRGFSNATSYGRTITLFFFQGSAAAARYGEEYRIYYADTETVAKKLKEFREIIGNKKDEIAHDEDIKQSPNPCCPSP